MCITKKSVMSCCLYMKRKLCSYNKNNYIYIALRADSCKKRIKKILILIFSKIAIEIIYTKYYFTDTL